MLVSPGGILPSEHGQLRSRPFCLHHGPSVERYSITYLCFYGLALAISFFQPLCAQALDEISNSVDSCAGILHLMMSYRMVERTSDSCAGSGAHPAEAPAEAITSCRGSLPQNAAGDLCLHQLGPVDSESCGSSFFFVRACDLVEKLK